MTESAHIYNPKDNSLGSRLDALKSTLKANRDVDASLKLSDSADWADQLGEREDLQKAHEIIKHSLRKAATDVSDQEIETAQEKGLLDQQEIKQVIMTKRQIEMSGDRASQSVQVERGQQRD